MFYRLLPEECPTQYTHTYGGWNCPRKDINSNVIWFTGHKKNIRLRSLRALSRKFHARRELLQFFVRHQTRFIASLRRFIIVWCERHFLFDVLNVYDNLQKFSLLSSNKIELDKQINLIEPATKNHELIISYWDSVYRSWDKVCGVFYWSCIYNWKKAARIHEDIQFCKQSFYSKVA